jgi:hypothetical protein
MVLAGKLSNHYKEIDMVLNSNFDDSTKQRMIAEIQSKYKRAGKEASRKKKVSPTQEKLK